MTLDEFKSVFRRLTGFSPMSWQSRLYSEHFARGELPSAVDIPTGLGKTAVMALWLIARITVDTLPRRLVYVVDRRAVVDQATRFAEQLREKIDTQFAKRLGLGEDGKLPISTLRGGFADNRDWLEDPSRPAIVVGTIDMIGSRLLFEGYGVSRNMRPYHAGFLGVDTLVVLDEAHLCPPFEALLRQIAGDHYGEFRPVGAAANCDPSFRLMSLSATGREASEISPFRLEEEDQEEPVVRERLTARKRLAISECENAKVLPEYIAKRALELQCNPPARVLVYCNSRTDAVKVKDLIDKAIKPGSKAGTSKGEAGDNSELLVGERRVYERRKLEHWLEHSGFLSGTEFSPDVPTFLIATSAGEVGVDLDADHMVCDLVAFERMVQRFGRVNRRGGKRRNATIDVFMVPEVPPEEPKAGASKGTQAKYRQEQNAFEAREARRAVLQQLSRGPDDRHNANFRGIDELKSDPHRRKIVDIATTPVPLYPALTRPHLDAWSMTSLKRHEGRAEVAPWLRGWEEQEEAQTEVVWRKYLPLCREDGKTTAQKSMVTRFFQCAPIHASEKLEAPCSHVFDTWLLKRAKQIQNRRGDDAIKVRDDEIIALIIDRAGELVDSATLKDFLFWGRPAKDLDRTDKRQKAQWGKTLASAILIVDARMAGLQDGLLKEQCDDEVPTADFDEEWRKLPEDPTDNRPMVKFRVEPLKAVENSERLHEPELEDWRHIHTFETEFDSGGSVCSGLAVYKWPDGTGDEDSRSILSAPQTLRDHANEAAVRVRQMAERLALPEDEIKALEIAARYHDDGKAAERWQNAMNAPRDERPYAKTEGGGNWRLLEGYRHEFGSLLRAEKENLPEATRDLILHLIAAHHGSARPLISYNGCEDGPPSLLEVKAGEAALRFAWLQKRYGPWGLAWREAILRAADQSVSREWDRRSRQLREGRNG